MDKFSSACNFPSKPDGYKNTTSTEQKYSPNTIQN